MSEYWKNPFQADYSKIEFQYNAYKIQNMYMKHQMLRVAYVVCDVRMVNWQNVC